MASKTGTVILAATSVTTTAINSSTVTLTTADGCSITCQLTNGTVSPTTACTAVLQVAVDGATWVFYQSQTAGLTVSTAYAFSFDLPPAILYARMQFTATGSVANSGVTCVAQSHVVNSL